MTQRTERIDELLRQEIGEVLRRDVDDPRIGFATITEVETTPDLRHARVWVSVIGAGPERSESIAALQSAMPFVRRELGRRLRLKRIPELQVRLDDSAERGTRVLKLLRDLSEGRPPAEEPAPETLPTPVPRLPHEGDALDEPGSATQQPAPPARSKRTGRRPTDRTPPERKHQRRR